MSYFAAAVVRGPDGWAASELELTGAADVEEVGERLRDIDPDAELSLLFVEADDAYLVILRLDLGGDLRVFGSDSAFAEESRLGNVLLGEVDVPAVEDEELSDDDEDRPSTQPDIEPVGDGELLADLGVPGQRLIALCAHDGMLPADITAEVCQAIGCGDEVEELREA